MKQLRSRAILAGLIVGTIVVAVGVVAAVTAGWNPLGVSKDTQFVEPFRSQDGLEPDPEDRFAESHFIDSQKDAICEAMRDSAAEFIDRDITTLDYDQPRHREEAYCGASEVWDDDDAAYGDLYAFVDFFEYTSEHIDAYETAVVDETEKGHADTTARSECWFLEQNFLNLDGDEMRGFTGSEYGDFEEDENQYCRTSANNGPAGFFTTHQTQLKIEVKWPDEVFLNDDDAEIEQIYEEFEDIRDHIMTDVFAALP